MKDKTCHIITDDNIKEIELSILKYIDLQCKKYNLRYYLGYGTLLGAVRHQGFIPWDDDIDIWMPREDYDKFISLENSLENSKFKILSPLNNSDYYYGFAKLVSRNTEPQEIGFLPIKDYGVYVDIFPLDNIATEHPFLHFIAKYIIMARIASCNIKPWLNLTHKKKAILFRFIGIIGTLLGFRRTAKLTDKIAKIDKGKTNKRVGVFVESIGEHNIFATEYFASTIQLKFEGIYFNAPKEYRKCLTQLYGDYMQLPPENRRISGHSFKACYRL